MQVIQRPHAAGTMTRATFATFCLGLCAFSSVTFAQQFSQPSTACPGAIETVLGEPDEVSRSVSEVRIPSGGTATCNNFPRKFPDPDNPFHNNAPLTQIVADGSGVTFVNNVAGIQGSKPIFEVAFTGNGHKITNNGDLFVLATGANTEVINASGFMTGLIVGDDSSLTNQGVVLGITIEGDRVKVNNEGGIVEGFPDPVPGARGVLVIGSEADIINGTNGGIGVQGTESIAVGAAGDRSKILNAGQVSAEGTEAIGLGIDGDGQAAAGGVPEVRTQITNVGSVSVTGTEAIGAIVGGDLATISNSESGTVVAEGLEAIGLLIEGDDGVVGNGGTLTAQGNLSAGMAIVGERANLENSGTIATTGNVTAGIAAIGADAKISNGTAGSGTVPLAGNISTDGESAFGMGAFGTGAEIINTKNSEIETQGAGSHGIFLGLENSAELADGVAIPAGTAEKAQGIVTNDGTIETTGVAELPDDLVEPASADGIHIFADNSQITNTANGVITTNGRNSAAIKAIGDDITVDQSGIAETKNDYSNGIDVTGDRAIISNSEILIAMGNGSDGIATAGNRATITNSGGINVGVLSNGNDGLETTFDNVGVSFEVAPLETSTVLNDDTGVIIVRGDNARGIEGRQTGESGSIEVRNKRRIDVAGSNVTGVNLVGDNVAFYNGVQNVVPGDLSEINVSGTSGEVNGVLINGNGVLAANQGKLTVEGENAVGLRALITGTAKSFVENSDQLTVKGSNAVGLSLATEGDVLRVVDSLAGKNEDVDCLGLSRGAQVLNCGTISIEGEKAVGMIASGIQGGVIENDDTIQTSAPSNGARGMVIERTGTTDPNPGDAQYEINNVIFNFGDIRLAGDGVKGVEITGSDNVFINNIGTTRLFAGSDNELFISVMQDIENDKQKAGPTVNRQANILVNGPNAVGLDINGNNNIVGLNLIGGNLMSTIIAQGVGSTGVRLAGEGNIIVNDGLISGGGMGVQGGSGNDIVENNNTILGGVDLAGGDDIFTLLPGATVTGGVNGGLGKDFFRVVADFHNEPSPSTPNPPTLDPLDLIGDDFVNFENFIFESVVETRLSGNLVLNDANGPTRATIEKGEFNIRSNGFLDATEIFVSQNGRLSGTGTVSTRPIEQGGAFVDGRLRIDPDGFLGPGNSPGMLTILGNVELAGTLEIEIAGLSAGLFDQLFVDGDLFIDGGLFEFNFIESFFLNSGDVFDFLTVTGELSGVDSLRWSTINATPDFLFEPVFTELSGGGFSFGLMTMTIEPPPPVSVSEPNTLALLLAGLAAIVCSLRRRKSQFVKK